jgi:outer membrane immunogenic protein
MTFFPLSCCNLTTTSTRLSDILPPEAYKLCFELTLGGDMKSFLLATAATLGLAGFASAADLPVKAPPPIVAPAISWTGCYIGGHVSGAWADTNRTWAVTDHYQVLGDSFSHDFNSVGGGAQVGCQYQFNQFVLGIEGTGTWYDNGNDDLVLSPFGSTVGSDPIRVSSNLRNIYTVVGRAGYVVVPEVLLYVKGGFARTDIGSYIDDSALHFSGDAQRHNGWTIGAGVEWQFFRGWVLGLDYGYVRAESKTHVSPVLGPAPAPPLLYATEIDADIHTVQARISYLFNVGGAPVVARY